MFIDRATISITSGTGGDGVVSFRREKFVPRGGPDGGDGGRGGDVIFVAEARVRTLLRFRYERHFAAENGKAGGGNQRHGKNGKDIVVTVPVGTVIYEADIDEPLVDLSRPGMTAVIASGGRGGRGNSHYATPSRQVPRFAEKGEPGLHRELRLELKLLADVGLLGLPNAGKSTLLAHVSAATPKIADYPFTTLEPQLGVVRVSDERAFVMADLPGLIEGAAHGRGRGIDFLRHAERSRVLLHIVDASGGFAGELDPWEGFLTINREIGLYGTGLERLPMLVALNKCDLPAATERLPDLTRKLEHAGYRVFPISAATGEGVPPLLYAIDEILRAQEAEEAATQPAAPMRVVIQRARRELEVMLVDEGVWDVTGTTVERILAITDLESEEAVDRMQRTLERLGIFAAMRERGVKEGDKVRIRGVELTFMD
jgi:GTP-binding protein